jgi:DNA-binding transcriptional ArsR family regulator
MSNPPSRLLAHPLRHRVLLEYQSEPSSPSEVARRLGEPLNLVSYHSGVLLRHGWLELVRTEHRRGGVAHVYRATSPGFIEDDEWQTMPVSQRRALVRGLRRSAVDDARRAAREGGFDHRHAQISRWPMLLDDEGVAQAAQLLRRLVDELGRIETRSRRRAQKPRERAEVVLMGFAVAPDAPATRASGPAVARSR